MGFNPRLPIIIIIALNPHVDLRALETSRNNVAYAAWLVSLPQATLANADAEHTRFSGRYLQPARPPLLASPGPADACVMQGHGRTDHETPVHLAYRIRQELDRSRQSDNFGAWGYDAGDRRTVLLFLGSDERLPAFDVLQIFPVHTYDSRLGKMTLGLGSLPPEYRHMQVKSRLANRSRNRVHYHGTLSLQSAVFVPDPRACSQGIKPRVAIWSNTLLENHWNG